jgi:hypothetical protein
MNITDYKKKYLKYKAKYLNIKGGGTPQSKPNEMNIDKAKAAVRNINFLITAFLPKHLVGEFDMRESTNSFANIVTSHTFNYYMREYLLYEFKTSNGIINDSDPNKIYNPKENYNTLVNGLTNFGVKGLKNYDNCMEKECKVKFKRDGKLSDYPNSAINYMNKLMYINAIYILSILKYDYIYNLYKWLIINGEKKKNGEKKNIEDYCTNILNSIFALKLAIYYLIINSNDASTKTYEESMFSKLGINENKLIELMNNNAINDEKCNKLFDGINDNIVTNPINQKNIKKIGQKLLVVNHHFNKNCIGIMDVSTLPNELTNPDILYDMLPFIYSLIQQIYEYNQNIYNFGKKDVDINNSSTTGYNFDFFKEKGTPSIVIYRSLYKNDNYTQKPYYAEIKDVFTDLEKKHIIDIEQKPHPFSIIKKLQDKKIENKYIPIGCDKNNTIAYAYVSLINK